MTVITLLQCWLAIPVAADDSTSQTVLAASGANRYTPGRPPPNSRALSLNPPVDVVRVFVLVDPVWD